MNFLGSKAACFYNNELVIYQRDDKAGLPYAGQWDFFGGGRENDETPEETLIREIQEELGITIDAAQIAFKAKVKDMLDITQDAYFFVVHFTDDNMKQAKLGDEGQQMTTCSVEDFLLRSDVVEPLKGRLALYFHSLLQPQLLD